MTQLMPSSYRYAKLMYDELYKRSKVVAPTALLEYGYPASEKDEVRIYNDFVYEAGNALRFTVSQQNVSMNILKASRCIEMIKHGAPRAPAVYILNFYPTDEILLEFRETSSRLGMKIVPRKDELYTRDIAELRLRVQKLESQVKELQSGRHDVGPGSSLP